MEQKKIEIQCLSNSYSVRRMNFDDVELIYSFCAGHEVFYRYNGKALTRKMIEDDLKITPPGIPPERKYYVGFFEGKKLIAVMDIIDGYPQDDTAFIGFFMVNSELEGREVGSFIVSEVLAYLKTCGFAVCRLGIDMGNPQSSHFWKKNGFITEREAEREHGAILIAAKEL